MLRLVIEGDELYNEETEEFDNLPPTIFELEHSLVSVSKWESKYQRPFLSKGKKTPEEVFNYLWMMVLTPGVDPKVFFQCSQRNLAEIQEYIDSPQSATTFSLPPDRGGPQEVITSELIYYWMVMFNIPFECQHWHLNRLLTLIRVCNVKNSKPQKMSRNQLAQRNAELNARRKAELGTRG